MTTMCLLSLICDTDLVVSRPGDKPRERTWLEWSSNPGGDGIKAVSRNATVCPCVHV